MKVRSLVLACAALALTGCGESGLKAGAHVSGVLEASDASKETGEIVDSYTLHGERGQQFVLRLNSSEFDPYLYVRGPGNLSEDNDDDPGAQGSLNARLSITFPVSGDARIFVTSYQRNQTGAYELTIEQPAAAPAAATGAQVAQGRAIDGELADGDAQLKTGEFVDTYPYEGHAGENLEIRMSSSEFDPYVAITGPNGFQNFNDDDVAGGSHNSRLIVTLPTDGAYTLHATSYAPGEHGHYRLEVNPSTQTAPSATAGASGDTIAIGQTVAGALAPGDTTLRSGEFTDTYHFEGAAGQRVAIGMHSTALDPYLILVAPSGAQEDNDDATQGDTHNSRIETVLGETGQYSIVATSFQRGETGAYTLDLAQSAASAPITGPSARRIFAVMVGISDYPGAANDLPFTAEDARKLRETLDRQGVLASSSVMLIDAQATRAAVRQAFQRVAAEAGPDDLFLFFYSGHGGQTRTQVSATEPDGKNETLELYDGAMLDDELAQLFNEVHARTALLVLDSCFSGGFARDVVSHPGVMGLFSSEEDLTSAVADKFQAGGYLSHFIQTGLSGEADENHDRVITAGELSAYVRREFAEEVRNVGSVTSDGQRSYQFPVVDRGAVEIDAPVLALR
ncbi:MAG TPA: caspase family protein [Caulobacterales bacterium]|nr:caspase family protein [Caulobacterales bacterium]